jgi:hypothetical protein
MSAPVRFVLLLWAALTLVTRAASASESGGEAELAAITVMVTGKLVDDCAIEGAKCTSGAGVILAIDRDGYPLVYTARHLAHIEHAGDTPMSFTVDLKDGQQIPAVVKWESDERLDVLVLQLKRVPRHTANFKCPQVAVVNELTSQTELAAVGSPNWEWSRLNRFNRADDQFVYMETPADKSGFSGGPVFVRGTLELVGLYLEGAEGKVKVTRFDSLPEPGLPENLAGSPAGAPILSTLGCRMRSSRFLALRDTTFRAGIGFAQLNAPVQQLASPLVTVELGQELSLTRLSFVTIGLYGSLHLGASYFDRGNGDRTFYGQGFYNVGLRLGAGPGFIDGLVMVGASLLGENLKFTTQSFRLALARRMGDGVAGLAAGYISRSDGPDIMTFEIFSDFVASSAGGIAMPGVQPDTTGDPHVDALLERERFTQILNLGGVLTTASDQPFALGGTVVAVQLSPTFPMQVNESVGIHARETLELQFGRLRIKDEDQTYFAAVAELGYRFRFWLPTSLLVDVFYYLPAIAHYEDRFLYPLVGAGAGIGGKFHQFSVRAVYRLQLTKVLYPSEPNLAFAGLSGQIDL